MLSARPRRRCPARPWSTGLATVGWHRHRYRLALCDRDGGAVGRFVGLLWRNVWLMRGLPGTLNRGVYFCRFLNYSGLLHVSLWEVRQREMARGFPVSCKPMTMSGRIPMTQIRKRPSRGTRRRLWPAATIVTAGTLGTMALGVVPASAHTTAYRQINLVSDQHGKAPLTDPDLVNAWGLAASPGTDATPGSPLWVADNGSDKATLYTGATATSVSKASLVVNVTGAAPTGQVFNSDHIGFVVQRQAGALGFVGVYLRHRKRHDRRLEPGGRRHGQQPVHGDRGGSRQRRQRRVQGPGDRPGL